MKMKQLGLGIVLAMLCGVGIANELSDKIAAMSESGRRGFFSALIQQSGSACPSIQRTFFQGTMDKSTIWNLTCSSREQYGVVFVDDAVNTTRVMRCAQLPSLGTPACFKKIKD